MSIWVNKDTKIVVQGLTGKEGRFHAEKCRDYGSQVVADPPPDWKVAVTVKVPPSYP